MSKITFEQFQKTFVQNLNVKQMAVDLYGSEDVEIYDDSKVEYVDGGAWVEARVFVPIDEECDLGGES